MAQERKCQVIKIENVVVSGWEAAIRGMRNPMNSWMKSDSHVCTEETANDCICPMVESGHSPCVCNDGEYGYCIGVNDMALMKKLAAAGPVHGKYLRFITVTADVVAPLYWWSEYDTYKVATVANSCSKMHKLLHKPFEMSDFSFDKLPGFQNEIKQFRPVVDEETELWRRIDADYDVSNQGRVRHGGRILSGSVHRDNYIFVTLHGKQIPVHRLVAEAFIQNYEKKPEVNHIDGNKMNNAVDNLEWVTRAENQKHAVDNGLQPKPAKTYQGKFTAEQRDEIKRLWDSGMFSRRQLSKKFSVSHTCINDIINDKYKYAESVNVFEEVARPIVDTLNELRDSYFACENEVSKKQIWYSILQLLPESYNQRRTVLLNYAVLANIYQYRHDHKLDEWRDFCKWIETLPYSEVITGERDAQAPEADGART